LRGGRRQNRLDPPEVGDLRAHIGQVPLGSLIDLGAGPGTAVDEIEEAANLRDGETELTGAQDEAQTGNMAAVVDPVTCARARRVRHHADLLVIAGRFEIAAGASRQLGPLQPLPGNVIAHRHGSPLSL
jgi:hypothetical protein